MKYLIIFLLFLQLTLSGNISTIFEEEDPTLFHHVNVITGHLNLSFEDTVVEGGVPLPIVRSYSSGGALQHSLLSDSTFEKGWRLFPHIRLYMEGESYDHETLKIYLLDKVGNPIKYAHKKKGKDKDYLFPVEFSKKRASNLSSRKNPEKNFIKINPKKRTATLFASDGSILQYSNFDGDFGYLEYEILPSKHYVFYSYENGRLSSVQLKNQKKTKILAAITFETQEIEDQIKLTAHTSDGKTLTYQLFTYDRHDYIEDVSSDCRPREHYCYEGGRKGIAARVNGMEFGYTKQFTAEYYRPKDKKEEKKWADKVPKKNYSADKVHVLKSPVGPEGALIPIATFTYEAEYTDVRDVDNQLIRYHHTNNKLNAIEYFDKHDKLHSVIKFYWEKENLKTKALFDLKGAPLFAKTFTYDERDRVIGECFRGSFSGLKHSPLAIDSKGEVQGGECISKRFSYFGKLIEEDEEIGGLTTHYSYLPNTDLITAKIVSKDGEIKVREFFLYDTDHLLACQICDDGRSLNHCDLSGVTERRIKTYEQNPHNGLCLSATESYLDLETGETKQLTRRVFTHNTRCKIETETIFDENNQKRYTITIEYDNNGNIKRKTTPLGFENTYNYDSLNNLIESKEVGQLGKKIRYDNAGRPIQMIEVDGDGNEKIAQTSFDAKGRPLTQRDSKGNSTTQIYDDFGNCTTIYFPEALDEKLQPYIPVATFSHDTQGNIISHTDPKGHCTSTTYNTLRKPIKIEYPDGGIIQHIYHPDGTLAKTIHPDGTEDHYTYDVFRRQESKSIYSANGRLLSSETWDYNSFHLLSYTNPEGLVTTYTYDGAGRLIAEQAENRIVNYHYDPLGNLERTTRDGYSEVRLHNEEGDIVEQWEEDRQGTIENLILFYYDSERRKERAIRHTSQGEAVDLFAYDREGRLCEHTDPHGEITQLIYSEETINNLGQNVLTKTTIDQIGNQTIETFDALNRLTQIEKRRNDESTVSKELILYDQAGNRAERQVIVFQDTHPHRTHTIRWEYDSRGRIFREIEENEKITTFSYDKKGRLRRKREPNGIEVCFNYDGLDRLTELYSSDNNLSYQYGYGLGPSPTTALDKVHQLLWKRTYNAFGEMTLETSPTNATLAWDYDDRGRCILFTLPDHSAIEYRYNDLHLTQVTRLSPTGSTKYAHAYTHFDENGYILKEDPIHQLETLTTLRDLCERLAEKISPYHRATIKYGPSGLVETIDNTLFEAKEYQYDPLNQLSQEGSQTYHFDSIGNPINAKVNHLNQIYSAKNIHLIYDPNGNPTQRLAPEGTTLYTYDPLNRLSSIEKPGQSKTQFIYDPFSRLYAQTSTQSQFFLYDHDIEIGLLDEENRILELKVIGLGPHADIGATVALELNGQAFAPLHDFGGSIIGLISSSGELVESYDIGAFGQENCSRHPLNPWRFHSKRQIEGLIFFGQRFYDPELGRWLTPDPAGFIDGPNLYLYVYNSPLNRLDLFGLNAVSMEIPYEREFYHNSYPQNYHISFPSNQFLPLRVTFNDIQVDWLITSNVLHKIKVSPEEINLGKINILNHFNEMFPKEGQFIALTSFMNGVKTNFEEHGVRLTSIVNIIADPEHVFIGMHLPTEGFIRDIVAATKERKNEDTPMASITRQVLVAISESLHKINPELIHLHITHSRGGATHNCSYNGMTPEQKNLILNHLYFIGVAPASPISNKQAMKAFNFYSDGDAITGGFGRRALRGANRADFTIQFLERTSYSPFKEHSILETTCQKGLKGHIDFLKESYKFYGK